MAEKKKKAVDVAETEKGKNKKLDLNKSDKDSSKKESSKKESAKKENSQKEGSKSKSSESKQPAKAAEKKPSVFSKIAKYFRECKSEVKKIVWPTPKATFRNMGIVLAVLLVIGLFIFVLDTGLIALLGLIMDMGKGA
ncbi:MAG: preprotein translocase subunit SecE [Clostridia bacterium]|nr:preprotein translocase subunit SecE [Clostridia bacterium]